MSSSRPQLSVGLARAAVRLFARNATAAAKTLAGCLEAAAPEFFCATWQCVRRASCRWRTLRAFGAQTTFMRDGDPQIASLLKTRISNL
jgi:hypothetical protein